MDTDEKILIPLQSNAADAQDVLEEDIYEKDGKRFTLAQPVWQWDAKFQRAKPLGVNIRPVKIKSADPCEPAD